MKISKVIEDLLEVQTAYGDIDVMNWHIRGHYICDTCFSSIRTIDKANPCKNNLNLYNARHFEYERLERPEKVLVLGNG